MVFCVRKQFREHPGSWTTPSDPTTAPWSTSAPGTAARAAHLGLLAVLAPIATGFLFESATLGAYLAGAILTGQLLAVMLSASGGAWDNAKKYVEDGHHGGKNLSPTRRP